MELHKPLMVTLGGNGRVEPSPQYAVPSHSNGGHKNGSPTNGFVGQDVLEQRFEESAGSNGQDFGIPLPSVDSNGAAPQEFPQDVHVGGFEQEFVEEAPLESIPEEISCPEDQVIGSDGICVDAEVSKTIYVYSAPERVSVARAEIPQPKPKLNYNIVFVKAPEGSEEDQPIVIPPPQQKTIVYVLSKSDGEEQQIIEVPAGPEHKPEVFYISYEDGENPQLPLGLDLESALASAVSQAGKVVEIEKEINGDDFSGDIEVRVQVEGEGDAEFHGDTGLEATNGFTSNVATNGVATNGATDEYSTNGAATNGASNGYSTQEVAINGATDGHSINGAATNGASNGFSTKEAAVNGAANGHFTNGAINGHSTNGAINGHSTNGATKGYSTNGATNGIKSNGATNGFGTNGFSKNGASNGFSSHGVTNGFSSNGAVNGFSSQKVTNGFSSNGAANGFSSNGATNGFADQTGIPLPTFERQNGHHAQPAQPQKPSGLYNTPLRRRI